MSQPDKPKKRKVRPRLPAPLRQLADKAIAKHKTRPALPRITVEGDEWSVAFSSPYAPRDHDAWEALLYQAFGTRSRSVVRYFLDTLAGLVQRQWDDKAHKWEPSQFELEAVLAIVNSIGPRNEAEAAYAVQLCALQLSAMQMAKHTTTHYGDARSLAVLNKTVRAYGDGLLNLKELQGKRRRRTTQVFRIEKHEHKHVHLPERTEVIEGSAAVPGQGPLGSVVPFPSGEGVPRLSDARGQGKRRSKG